MITMRFAGKPVVLLFTLVCFLPFIQSSGTEGATCKYLHKGKTLTTKCQDRPDAYCCGVRNAQCCYKNFEPLDKWWFWLCISIFLLILVAVFFFFVCCYCEKLLHCCGCYKPTVRVYGNSESKRSSITIYSTSRKNSTITVHRSKETKPVEVSEAPTLFGSLRKMLYLKSKKSVPWDDEETMLVPGGSGRRRLGRPVNWVGNTPKIDVEDGQRKLEDVCLSDITALSDITPLSDDNSSHIAMETEGMVYGARWARDNSSTSIFSDVSLDEEDGEMVKFGDYDDPDSRMSSAGILGESGSESNSSDFYPFDERMCPTNHLGVTEAAVVALMEPGETHTPSSRMFSMANKYTVRSARVRSRGARRPTQHQILSRSHSSGHREIEDILENETDSAVAKSEGEN